MLSRAVWVILALLFLAAPALADPIGPPTLTASDFPMMVQVRNGAPIETICAVSVGATTETLGCVDGNTAGLKVYDPDVTGDRCLVDRSPGPFVADEMLCWIASIPLVAGTYQVHGQQCNSFDCSVLSPDWYPYVFLKPPPPILLTPPPAS